MTGNVRTAYATVRKRLFGESGSAGAAARACLSRWFDHRLAILVNQGSDPTVPYQALVIRESAMLFRGFAPWGQKAFSAGGPAAAGPTPLTLPIVPRRRPSVLAPAAGGPPGVGDRAAGRRGSSAPPLAT